MKLLLSLLLLINAATGFAQAEDYYGPVKISFHGLVCNRPTNDDPLGMDGVSDEVSVDFWSWSPVTNNRAAYSGAHRVYGEDFLLPERIKAGTATINGGLKAGNSYYREGVYDDDNLLSLSKYDIVNTFCSNSTLVAIFPAIFEVDNGPLTTKPIQDLYIATRRAFNDPDIQNGIRDFSDGYVYNDNNPYGFMLAGRHIGLDALYAGLFTTNKNKLASRPIGLFSNWDYSSQLIVLTPKTIKIISEKDYGYGKGILPVHFNEESMGNTEGHGNYIVLLRFICDIKDRNAGNPPPNIRTISVKVNNVMPGEEYKFRLWTVQGLDTIIIKHPNTTMNFPVNISPGQFYNVVQVAGPGICQLINDRGSVGPDNIVVTANCAELPTNQKIGVKVNAVGSDEIFEFSAGPNRKVFINEANKVFYFPGTFSTGQNYTITQVNGPRDCGFSPATGQVGHEDIIIDANCGELKLKTRLRGKFTAPKGTTATLKLNNIETLKIVQTNEATGGLGTTPFTFTTLYPVGSDYQVTIQTTPGNTVCAIYENAEGQIDDTILVGVRYDKGIDLVSRSADNKVLSTYYESFTPVIGGKQEDEGRYVAFGSSGKGMDGSSGGYRQIFWRDRKLGITKLISRTPGGEEANGSCFAPAISADGQFVAFESYATNLAGGDNNGVRDVFVWSEGSGVILVSKGQYGEFANGESYEPTISGDGSVIAYTSNASNIVKLEPVFSTPNVYVYNGGNNIFITKDPETGKAVTGYSPSISEDGTRVAFCAYTNKLVKNDNNNLWDIFLWQSGIPGLKRISFTASGTERNQGTESASRVVAPAISGDGRWVAYATTASNMVPGDDNGMQDIFICNSSGGEVRRISEGNGDSPISQGERIGISYNGNWITYNTNADNLGALKGNIVLQNTRSGKLIPITAINGVSTARPLLSRSGGYIIAGCSEKYDKRFPSSGIFVFYTGQ
ncbi:MAG TPA: hypothetical protein VGO58_09270 [Chitinophagaceae bacterium]|jgi:Tol biopolymer transport system component|nr:hypothetical protein [Chitinophagaceae bacterium]